MMKWMRQNNRLRKWKRKQDLTRERGDKTSSKFSWEKTMNASSRRKKKGQTFSQLRSKIVMKT